MKPYPTRLARAIAYAERIGAGVLPELVLGGVGDAVVVTDPELDAPGPIIIFVNAAFERLSGYPRDELIGCSPRMLQGFDTDRAELVRMKAQLVAGECFEGAVLNYHKSGMEYVVGWAIAPVRARDAIRAWVSVQNDVMKDARASRRG